MLKGYIAVFLAALVTNIAIRSLSLDSIGFTGHPVAHTEHLWNFLGLALVGLGSVLLGGCPLRQLILTGEGNIDSGVTVLGMLVGAAFAHNFTLASSPAGATSNGKVAVIIGFVVMGAIVISHSKYILARRGQHAKVGR